MPAAESRRVGLALAGLVALVVLVYLPVRHHAFVEYDDDLYIVENPNLRQPLGLESVARAFREPYEHLWVPLTWLSLHVEYRLHGASPRGYLATNVALHALAAVLLYAAFARMTGARWRSLFVAAVFAVHPLRVESVAWAAERKDVLAGVFWMLALVAHARLAERPRSVSRYLAVALCLVLGLLSKPMVVTLPFALLLLDDWPLRRLSRRAVLEKLPLVALAAAASAVTVWVQRESGALLSVDRLPLGDRIANALDSYGVYLVKTVWPTGLAAFYPHPRGGLPPWRVAGAALLLASLTALALRAGRARPYLRVGWLWYLGTLVPVIGLVQTGLHARADRFTYLPSIGLALIAAWGVPDLLARVRAPRWAAPVAGACAIAALAVAASLQVRHWSGPIALYERAIAVTEDNYLAHKNLGDVLLAQGRLDEAERHYLAAARIDPSWSETRLGLADLRAARGDLGGALRGYEEVLRADPGSTRALGRYGLALLRAGRVREARPALERAVAAHGGVAELHAGLALAAAGVGEDALAAQEGREALRLDPALDAAANNLAWLLATTPDERVRAPEEAIALLEGRLRGAAATPSQLDTLAAAYAAAGRFGDAVETARRGERLARAQGRAGAAERFRERRGLYEQGRPYVERPAAGAAPVSEADGR